MLPLLSLVAVAVAGVEVLDPGAEPRAELRIEVQPGATQTLVFESRATTTLGLRGPLPDPGTLQATQRIVWSLEVTGTSDDEVTIRATLDEATMQTQGGMSDREPPDIAPFVGMSGTVVWTRRGELVRSSWSEVTPANEPSERLLKALRNGVERLAVPLPEEPVGNGASWRVRHRIPAGPFDFDLATVWTLKEPGQLTTKITVGAAPTEVSIGGITGVKGKVKEFAVVGTGWTDWSADQPGPTSRSVDVTTHLAFRGSKALIPFTMDVDVDQHQQVSAR